jgi:rare lipoprotein A
VSPRRTAGLLLLLGLGLSACTLHPAPAPAPPPAPEPVVEQPSFSETGVASWYGAPHQGRKTASGERFDRTALTAAHRSLPLGTTVRVTSLESGKSVKVRINDRGPHARGRIIDLSDRAAHALGLRDDGVGRVRLEVFASDQDRQVSTENR